MKKYAVLGFPLTHSLSPLIHTPAFEYLQIDADYIKIEIPPQEFNSRISSLKQENRHGFNVTIPFKQEVIQYLDSIDPAAEKIGAVNTISIDENNKWTGYNTDSQGFLKPLLELDYRPESCLLLGAGGAARAVSFGLAEEFKLQEMTIVNRSVDKAEKLAADLRKYYAADFTVCSAADIEQMNTVFDLIVNTTSVGMGRLSGQYLIEPAAAAGEKCVVYDLIYNPQTTKFLELAEKQNLKTINGLPMLIYQAALSFQIWTGQEFPAAVMDDLMKTIPMQKMPGKK